MGVEVNCLNTNAIMQYYILLHPKSALEGLSIKGLFRETQKDPISKLRHVCASIMLYR
jgi:hypothetical protein